VKFFAVLVAVGVSVAAQAPRKPMSASERVAECATLRNHGEPEARACYQKLIETNDPALQAEGFWGIGDFNSANQLFQALIKARPKDAEARVRWGRMYLDHWNGDVKDLPTAEGLFEEAAGIDKNNADAVLGMALVAADSFASSAAQLAHRALEMNPKLVEAQELLARIALEDNDEDKARAEAMKALEISPEALDAMAILASIDWLDDKKSTPWMEKALKINPSDGEVYAIAAHFFDINRMYDDEVWAYRKAIELKPDLWSARSSLGVALMRTGHDAESEKMLESAYNAGFQSSETVNTLRLLDTYKNYDVIKTPTTELRLGKKESALLQPYFQSELDRALATYEKKYHFKLTHPVRIEVYPNHEDFAVRTLGMPGIGALGVTFLDHDGYYVAMDSPESRPPGQFHWDSTMWHELSHVYVLAMTTRAPTENADGRPAVGPFMPRWFTEGLAVYEETGNGHLDWGDRLDPEAINAIKTKKLLPIAELDRGFVHPTYPAQVVVSYFQGGKICNFIAEKWGYGKLLDMIKDFGQRIPTVQVIQKEFQLKPEEFDKQFFTWLDEKTKVTVNGFDEWKKGVERLNQLAQEKQWDEIIQKGTAIRDLYTDYVEPGNVYEFLSEAYLAKGDKAKATAELERYATVGGRDPAPLKQLAQLQADAGRKQDAVATLERLNLIYLRDDEAHKKLGELFMDLHNPDGAVREFRAAIASGTVDAAGAHYELAKALQADHKIDEARDEVVSALEVAPGYKPAQKLLLELNVKE